MLINLFLCFCFSIHVQFLLLLLQICFASTFFIPSLLSISHHGLALLPLSLSHSPLFSLSISPISPYPPNFASHHTLAPLPHSLPSLFFIFLLLISSFSFSSSPPVLPVLLPSGPPLISTEVVRVQKWKASPNHSATTA